MPEPTTGTINEPAVVSTTGLSKSEAKVIAQAEVSKIQQVKTSTFTFDVQKVKEHFGKIEAEVNKFQGKKGHNPHFFLRDKVMPLVKRFQGVDNKSDTSKNKAPERSEDLYKAILALPTEGFSPLDSKELTPLEETVVPSVSPVKLLD